jgi:hypothetical protein
MSLWSRAPRQVYEVHGEDDCLAEDGAPPGERPAPELSASAKGSRSGRVLGLAFLVMVTLGAVAIVSLSLSHAPSGRQYTAERESSPRAARRAFPDPPTTAPPEVHRPPYSKRHARAPISAAAHPRRRHRRIAGRHAETPKIPIGPAGGQPSGTPTRGEFDFER